jgi:hypothetical protein
MFFTTKGLHIWECVGDSGEKYHCDTSMPFCSCKGFYYNKKCKHLEELGVRWSE